jgi:hypothetical protein
MVTETSDRLAKLEAALSALETEIVALGEEPSPDAVAEALAEPVAAFDAAAKEALA